MSRGRLFRVKYACVDMDGQEYMRSVWHVAAHSAEHARELFATDHDYSDARILSCVDLAACGAMQYRQEQGVQS